MRLRERDHIMNRLVEHMEEHHQALGTAFKFTRVESIMAETGWSRDEILQMATEANDEGELVATFSFRGNKWKVEAVSEDLITVGTISSSWKPHHKKRLER
jgi:hypothetical protein